MKDVEPKEMDQEKQPMTRETAREKNGCAKVIIPEEQVKFTGLSKDELMKIAGTGWVQTRRVLLFLFLLGWVGILAGAVVIIVHAPRCKPIPEMNWWNKGPLYQISNVKDFSDHGLKGVEEKLDYLNQMKVKGLVLGPVHRVQIDQLSSLNLISIKSLIGTENELKSLLDQAHKKGISIVLDLTPKYEGFTVWSSRAASVAEKLREACAYWLNKGFDGIFLSSVGDIVKTDAWPSIQSIFNKTDGATKRVLMGSVTDLSVDAISNLVNHSGVDLVITELSHPGRAPEVQTFSFNHLQASLGWNMGTPEFTRLCHVLLFTLPGTPVFNAGNEVGLKLMEKAKTMWDLESQLENTNATAKAVQENRIAARDSFKALSDLRGKERALLYGEYIELSSSTSTLAFLRLWDQSERFITAINWGNDPVSLAFTNSNLPTQAQVRISTDTANLALNSMVSLHNFQLGPQQAVLLSFPYSG